MNKTESFTGFPEGKLPLTPIPNAFFSELLPRIDHLGEFKVTIYAFWALTQKEGRFRYISLEEMAADQLLMEGLKPEIMTPLETLVDALERAVARGTFLKVKVEFDQGEDSYFFLNSPKGQAAVASIEAGDWQPTGDPEAPISLALERPNIYTLYEQNIGPLTPMIAEQLREAENEYPPDWIEEAVLIAVTNNVRKWRYIEAILEDWQNRGKDERKDRGDSEKARRRYVEGKFADFWDTATDE
ncbi:MAG: DnaD domain protein [Chloroflexi bacterium]|nr:DnaD domain protein [Chloroflexota bacterium]